MSLYAKTPQFCPRPRSSTNPSSLRGLINSVMDSSPKPAQLSVPFGSLRTATPKPNKSLKYASLSVHRDFLLGDLPRGPSGRTVSMVLPNRGTGTRLASLNLAAPLSQCLADTIMMPTTSAPQSSPLSPSCIPSGPILQINPDLPDKFSNFSALPHSPWPSTHPTAETTITASNTKATSDPVSQPPKMLHHLALRIPSLPSLSLGALHQSPSPMVTSPTIVTSHGTSSSMSCVPSPMARSRRAPSPSDSPPMQIASSPSRHTLDVQLPSAIQPEMVTISVQKGDRLNVVADAWHMERDCHYEWQISFPPYDIDMSSIHAKFDPDGHLTIDVRRRPDYTSFQG